ncbi:MAG TPA: KpsF/GutQ family sugar-phosphate isomerase [Bacteroidia bacterium]|nr:KpsF/GutQ family sugar-phosphate isomerase [Bacteroidia bacterium]HQW49793.1 KpsF/GutQ family sugar-phosphate isomerase [Bacteroidia bacterium]HQX70192.1 KpsF/GutQ family sugar-phosphate isomerase [Bacteroidia bacterium]HQZ77414.1 KpsF/GutQ family sugar-phosphate isomerase [Bacteroidia bacterium]HRB25570.1 KpsF/GutQ family sugar-phosphate isomerase [Bacteroidia bacterium]
MKSVQQIIKIAKKTLQMESSAISGLQQYIDHDFFETVKLIFLSKGRVVCTGIGKSAIIAQKITATLNSTGTPAVFMHAADAVHGDLGVIQKDDVVICISKSGNTPEIKVLAPLLRLAGNKLIAMVGDTSSYLAQQAHYILNTTVAREACPHNLAPTTSTTAQLAMGDALAVCLLENRGFSSKDFARYHPGGALGKRLYLKVGDVYKNNASPQVNPTDDLKKVIVEISGSRLGATAVVDKGKLKGIITDGDLRRMLHRSDDMLATKAKDIMTSKPKSVSPDTMAADAFILMKSNNITQLVVTDKGKYLGFIHLHDLLKEGIY